MPFLGEGQHIPGVGIVPLVYAGHRVQVILADIIAAKVEETLRIGKLIVGDVLGIFCDNGIRHQVAVFGIQMVVGVFSGVLYGSAYRLIDGASSQHQQDCCQQKDGGPFSIGNGAGSESQFLHHLLFKFWGSMDGGLPGYRRKFFLLGLAKSLTDFFSGQDGSLLVVLDEF